MTFETGCSGWRIATIATTPATISRITPAATAIDVRFERIIPTAVVCSRRASAVASAWPRWYRSRSVATSVIVW